MYTTLQNLFSVFASPRTSRRFGATTPMSYEATRLEERILMTVGADGWTELAPSADSRVIYVSSSLGNDSNDGLTESRPKKTIRNAYAQMRTGFPDWIRLKSGDTFTDGLMSWEQSGRSADEPMVLTSYGSGERPILLQTGFMYWGPNMPSGYVLQNLAFVDLNFQGRFSTNPSNSANTQGVLLSGKMKNILFEGNRFDDYRVLANLQFAVGGSAPINELSFRRNIFTNGADQGLMVSEMNTALVEENIFDYNGFGGGAATTKHNIYAKDVKNLTLRGNIFARGSNFGTKLSADKPGAFADFVVENNLYYNNGLSLDHSAGPTGDINTTFTHDGGIIVDNVFTESGRTFSNGAKQDLVGWLLNSNDVKWTANLFVNKPPFSNGVILKWAGHHKDITVEDSVVYNWDLESGLDQRYYLEDGAAYIDGYTLRDNEIRLPASSYVDPNRSVGSYYASIGGTNDAIAFLTMARTLSMDSWNTAWTADAVNDYMRGGFTRVLAAPVINGPENRQSANQRTTIEWAPVSGADGYEIWYSNLSTGQNPVLVGTSSGATFTPDTPLPVGRYRIWVRATHRFGGVSAWSSPVTMHINSAPNLNTPSSGGEESRPQFTWTGLAGSVRYEIWVDNVTTKTSRVIHSANVTDTLFAPSDDLGFSEYRVWVRGIDAGNLVTAWSNSIDYSRLNVVSTLNPLQFDGQGGLETVTWTPIEGAVRYELWANNTTNGVNRAIFQSNLVNPSYSHAAPLHFGNYQFWVRGFDQQGRATRWSNAGMAVNTSSQLSPLDPTFNRRPTFTWKSVPGAITYELYVTVAGVVLNPTGIGSVQWTPAVDLGVGDMSWWVRPLGTNGLRGPWSAMGSSHTGGKARVLEAGVPAGGQGGNSVFAWTAVTGAARYILHVEQIGVGVVILRNDLTSTSFTGAPLSAGNYRAWVRAIDSRDNVTGIWSNVFNFSVVDADAFEPDSLLAGIFRKDDGESEDQAAVSAESDFDVEDVVNHDASDLMTEEQADIIDFLMAGSFPIAH